MEIPCRFAEISIQNGGKSYLCWIQNQQIPEKQELKFTAKHLERKTNNDVFHIKFHNCTVTEVPQGLKKIFPNLKKLTISDSKLKKISRNDLMEYKYLQRFKFDNNDLEFLPGDLFLGFEYLKYVSFYGNKLGVIEPNILNGLKNLEFVCFSYNPNFNKRYSIHPTDNPDATIKEIKNDLHEKYFSRFKYLRDIKNFMNKEKSDRGKLKLAEDKIKVLEAELKVYKDFASQIIAKGKISESELSVEMRRLKITLEKTSQRIHLSK